MTPAAVKAKETARQNREALQQKVAQWRRERKTIQAALIRVLEDESSTTAQILEAVTALEKIGAI